MTEQNQAPGPASDHDTKGQVPPASDDPLDDDTAGHACPRVIGDEDDDIKTD